jgi:hypothetical protein
MGDAEFMVLVAGIVGILVVVCSAARTFLHCAGPLPFIIVVIVGLGVFGEYAMPNGEFERMISDIWGPIVADIRHLSERAMH